MNKKWLGLISGFGLLALVSCGSTSMTYVNNSDTDSTTVTNAAANGNTTTLEDDSNKLDPVYVDLDVLGSTTDATSLSTSAVETVEEVYGSVVSITASSVSSASAGSGVLYASSEEYGLSFIITCHHVIEGATSFTVTYNNNTMDESDDVTYTAKLVGGNEDSDIAVLTIEATDLVYASFYEDSDAIKLGSSVVCIGNPLGTLPGSVSSGVVSYVNRSIDIDTYTTRKLIQTDVAINSGNSGGGLFNTAGALIGIVNAKYSSSSIEGLGFAIPSNEALSVANSLVDTALYDTANHEWSAGYVEGDYEFGFTISLGTISQGFNSRTYAVYVSEVESNDTYSGTNLTTNTVIKSVVIDYKDSSVSDTSYTVPSSVTSSTVTELMTYLYDAGLSLGDTVTFNYSNGTSVSFEIVQFVYSI